MNFDQVLFDISKTVEDHRQLDSNSLLRGRSLESPALKTAIDLVSKDLSSLQKKRIEKEFSAEGPLHELMLDPDIVEIMVTSQTEIWFEKQGQLKKHSEGFLSELTFNNFYHGLCDEAQIQTSIQFPFANGFWKSFRVHVSAPPVTGEPVITLRRLKTEALTLEQMSQTGWCSSEQVLALREAMKAKKNTLVLGNTGSGKTTLLNALLAETRDERSVIIEDTSEILAPNAMSVKMLTRFDSQGILPEISQSDLVKQSLRMRPDRLVIGEIRSGEAKDLLMALSTGHKGSMASIHAHSPDEALLRLEMLVQMGAPQWNLEAIRRLIHLCIDQLIVTKKKEGKWFLEGVYKIASQEQFGFIVERV